MKHGLHRAGFACSCRKEGSRMEPSPPPPNSSPPPLLLSCLYLNFVTASGPDTSLGTRFWKDLVSHGITKGSMLWDKLLSARPKTHSLYRRGPPQAVELAQSSPLYPRLLHLFSWGCGGVLTPAPLAPPPPLQQSSRRFLGLFSCDLFL